MVAPPEEYDSGYWHFGVYASPTPSGREDFAVEAFDTADIDTTEVREAVDLIETARDALDSSIDPRSFEGGDLMAVLRFDKMARRGWTVAASTAEPGVETIIERTTDADGDLTITPDDGWVTTGPRQALDLEEGDLLYATTAGMVLENRPEGIVYGWPLGQQYLYRPQGSTSNAQVFRWDREAEQIDPTGGDDNGIVFTPTLVRVYKSPTDDPIIGFVPETDRGFDPWEPFFRSDFPNGYDLDPYIRSQEEASELIGEDVFTRQPGGVVYESEPLQEPRDGAGLVIETVPSLTYTYYLPSSPKHGESELDLIAVPADNPFIADTTDQKELATELFYQPDPQRWEVGIMDIEGGSVDAESLKTAFSFAQPGDVFQLESDASGVPSGEMVVPEGDATAIRGEVTLIPRSGSKEYVLVAGDRDRSGMGVAPLRLRERDSGDSVGRVQAFTVRRPPADERSVPGDDTTTEEEAEEAGMSDTPTDRMIQERYDSVGTTESAVLDALKELGLPAELEEWSGIGPARADTLRSFDIDNAADLGVLARSEGDSREAHAPLSRALEDLNASGREAVMEAAETVRDLALDTLDADVRGRSDRDVFPLDATVVWQGDTVEYVFDTDVPNPESRIDADVLDNLTETFELIHMGETPAGRQVAEVTFPAADAYDVDDYESPLDLRPSSEFSEPQVGSSENAPSRDPDFVVEGPDGTRYEAYGAQVYAYPADVSARTKLVDETRAEKLDVPNTVLEEKVENNEGFTITIENRADKIPGGDERPPSDAGGGSSPAGGDPDRPPEQPPESEPEPEQPDDTGGGSGPTVFGLSVQGAEALLSELMPGTEPLLSVDGDEITVGWQKQETTAIDFDRDSAVFTGPLSSAETVTSQILQAYYDNAALSADRVESITNAIEESGLDLPKPPTSGGRAEDATDPDDGGESDSSATDAGRSQLSPEERRAIEEMEEAANNMNTDLDSRQYDAAAAIEDIILERYGDIIEGLFPVEIVYDSNQVSAYNIRMGLTEEGRDRIAGIELMESFDLYVIPRKLGQLFEDLDNYISNLDTQRPGNEETKETLQRLDNLTTLDIERGRVDIEQLLLTPEQVSSFAAYNLGDPERPDDVWFGPMLNRIKETSKAMWAAQLVYQTERGDEQAEEFVTQQLGGRTNYRRGSAVWYLDIAERLAQQGDFDPVDFIQRWHNAADRIESTPGSDRGLGPDNQPPKLDPYTDSPAPDRDPDPQTGSTGPRDPQTEPRRGETSPEPSDSGGGGAERAEHEVFVVQRRGDRQVGIRFDGDDDITFDPGTDMDRRSIYQTVSRRVDPRSAAQDVFLGTVTTRGGEVVDTDLLRELQGIPIEEYDPDAAGTPTDTGSRSTGSGTQTPGESRGDPGSSPAPSTTRSGSGGESTDIGEADIETINTDEVSIGEADINIGGDVNVDTDSLDMGMVRDIEDDIEEDIGS